MAQVTPPFSYLEGSLKSFLMCVTGEDYVTVVAETEEEARQEILSVFDTGDFDEVDVAFVNAVEMDDDEE